MQCGVNGDKTLTLCPLWVPVAWGGAKVGLGGPEMEAVLAQGGDCGRWAQYRVRGASVELGTTFLHAVMGNATADCDATETWSSASIMPRHLHHGCSSTQKHPHDVTIKGSGVCNASPTSTSPRAAALVG